MIFSRGYKAFNQDDILKVVDFLSPQGILYQNSPKIFSPERDV